MCFSILLVNLKFNTWNLYKSDRFFRSRKKLFFGKFSMKSVNFGDKNLCFCEKPKYLVNKSTPSISRILYPETGHPICDHLELIFSGNKHKKSTKLMFFHTLWSPTFSTRSCAVYLWRSSRSPKSTSNFTLTFH